MKTTKKSTKRDLLPTVAILTVILAANAFGSATDLPWEGPLDKILKSLTGPVAKAVSILAVVGVGGMMAFGEMGSAIKKLLSVVLGIALIFAAATWVPTFFGFTGSALF